MCVTIWALAPGYMPSPLRGDCVTKDVEPEIELGAEMEFPFTSPHSSRRESLVVPQRKVDGRTAVGQRTLERCRCPACCW